MKQQSADGEINLRLYLDNQAIRSHPYSQMDNKGDCLTANFGG